MSDHISDLNKYSRKDYVSPFHDLYQWKEFKITPQSCSVDYILTRFEDGHRIHRKQLSQIATNDDVYASKGFVIIARDILQHIVD